MVTMPRQAWAIGLMESLGRRVMTIRDTGLPEKEDLNPSLIQIGYLVWKSNLTIGCITIPL